MPEFSRGLRLLVGLASAAVVLLGLKQVNEIAAPAFLALVLTIAVGPLRTRLERRRAPGWVLFAVPLAVVLIVLLIFALALVIGVAQLVKLIPQYAPQYQELLSSIGQQLAKLGVTSAQAQQALSKLDPSKLLSAAQGLLGGLAGVITEVILIVLLLYTMSLDAVFLQRAVRRLRGSRPHLVGALSNFAGDTINYLVVSTVFGLIVAVLDGVALAILSVPLPVLWGMLAFITNYIPNVGFVIGLLPPALLALLDSGVGTMIWVIVIYCVLNFIIQSVIQPRFVGQSAGLTTTLTILSLLVWTWTLGALGAILAVPLSAFVRAILVDADPATVWASPLIAGQERR
ncbi:AI-2E family transporter [Nonomuraea sediminis]|uniref:AI-2E family transporter n=1 Tax=Nonomuraea sediminis TaxID=2835864 RepID=UPI0027E02BB1|nr:AI-2E family transporter [Nonomuraea sediminis]